MSDKHTGSCLCGAVKFEVIGEAKNFLYCHCSRCRKSTGSAHASNIFIDAEKINWISGEENRKSYKVPDAERYMRVFCENCGSLLPVYVAARNMVLIPAGTLDTEPKLSPQARIFNGSRANWCSDDHDLTCYEEYPV